MRHPDHDVTLWEKMQSLFVRGLFLRFCSKHQWCPPTHSAFSEHPKKSQDIFHRNWRTATRNSSKQIRSTAHAAGDSTACSTSRCNRRLSCVWHFSFSTWFAVKHCDTLWNIVKHCETVEVRINELNLHWVRRFEELNIQKNVKRSWKTWEKTWDIVSAEEAIGRRALEGALEALQRDGKARVMPKVFGGSWLLMAVNSEWVVFLTIFTSLQFLTQIHSILISHIQSGYIDFDFIDFLLMTSYIILLFWMIWCDVSGHLHLHLAKVVALVLSCQIAMAIRIGPWNSQEDGSWTRLDEISLKSGAFHVPWMRIWHIWYYLIIVHLSFALKDMCRLARSWDSTNEGQR